MKVSVSKLVEIALLTGVTLSFLVLVWGSILYVLHPHAAAAPRSASGILHGVFHLNPTATVNLGLFILLITPVLRVIVAMIAFALEKDGRFVLVSLVVLIVLALSAVVGR